jgi:hypothetical protein
MSCSAELIPMSLAIASVSTKRLGQQRRIEHDSIQMVSRFRVSRFGQFRQAEDHGVACANQIVVMLRQRLSRSMLFLRTRFLDAGEKQVSEQHLRGGNPGKDDHFENGFRPHRRGNSSVRILRLAGRGLHELRLKPQPQGKARSLGQGEHAKGPHCCNGAPLHG